MVIKYSRDFLDKHFSLKNLSWHKITSIAVKEGKLKVLKGADIFDLSEDEKFIGHRGEADNPSAIILKNLLLLLLNIQSHIKSFYIHLI